MIYIIVALVLVVVVVMCWPKQEQPQERKKRYSPHYETAEEWQAAEQRGELRILADKDTDRPTIHISAAQSAKFQEKWERDQWERDQRNK